MTKLDGTAKGGILIAVAKKYKLPILDLVKKKMTFKYLMLISLLKPLSKLVN